MPRRPPAPPASDPRGTLRTRLFVVVAALALALTVISGALLLKRRPLSTLCAPTRPTETVDELRRERWVAKLHGEGRILGYGGALLLVSLAVAAAFEARQRGSRRWPFAVAGGLAVLASVVVAATSGDRVPWHSLAPVVVAGEGAPKEVEVPPMPPELAIATPCGHEEQRAAIRRAYFAHAFVGGAALLFGLLLVPFAWGFRGRP